MSTREITRIALISAIAVVLDMFIVFRMPQGGSVSLYLVPLFIAASNDSVRNCLFIGIVVAIAQVVLGGVLASPASGLIDYLLPVVFMTTAGIFKPMVKNTYVALLIGCLLAFACYVISGMVFWSTPFVGSVTYNATFFIPTVIVGLVVFAIVNPRLSSIYKG